MKEMNVEGSPVFGVQVYGDFSGAGRRFLAVPLELFRSARLGIETTTTVLRPVPCLLRTPPNRSELWILGC